MTEANDSSGSRKSVEDTEHLFLDLFLLLDLFVQEGGWHSR